MKVERALVHDDGIWPGLGSGREPPHLVWTKLGLHSPKVAPKMSPINETPQQCARGHILP